MSEMALRIVRRDIVRDVYDEGLRGGVSGGERGIRTPGPVTVNGFQDRRIRPLCQLSGLLHDEQGPIKVRLPTRPDYIDSFSISP